MTFEEIYHTNKNTVYNLALQYTQNAEDASEIVQDVFLAVHKSQDNFRGEAQLTTWIYRITINKSLDFLKAKKRMKRFGFMTSLFYEKSGEIKYDQQHFNHPGVQLEDQEGIARIFHFINQLPDAQKTALILSKIEHKSQAEIAGIMNLSAKAVESLIQRAKQNLAKKLIPDEG